jgi:hypothetical protein
VVAARVGVGVQVVSAVAGYLHDDDAVVDGVDHGRVDVRVELHRVAVLGLELDENDLAGHARRDQVTRRVADGDRGVGRGAVVRRIELAARGRGADAGAGRHPGDPVSVVGRHEQPEDVRPVVVVWRHDSGDQSGVGQAEVLVVELPGLLDVHHTDARAAAAGEGVQVGRAHPVGSRARVGLEAREVRSAVRRRRRAGRQRRRRRRGSEPARREDGSLNRERREHRGGE